MNCHSMILNSSRNVTAIGLGGDHFFLPGHRAMKNCNDAVYHIAPLGINLRVLPKLPAEKVGNPLDFTNPPTTEGQDNINCICEILVRHFLFFVTSENTHTRINAAATMQKYFTSEKEAPFLTKRHVSSPAPTAMTTARLVPILVFA